ncbi:MAG: hypothetical protein IJ479_01890 [Alphaproteobacteria bacterium]|nr:hypothetical protein [Alphaproteobacteria bacterium]
MESVILKASQFIEAAKKECGIEFGLNEVHVGRLEFLTGETQKDNGYICFYAFGAGKVWYLKAFKGKTVRKVKVTEIKNAKVKIEFLPCHAFVSAYENTTWHVVKTQDDIELIETHQYNAMKKQKSAAQPA